MALTNSAPPDRESLQQSGSTLVNRLLAIESRLEGAVGLIFGAKPEAKSITQGVGVESSSIAADLRVSHRTVGRIEELISQLQDGL